jgi:hypothetical protein
MSTIGLFEKLGRRLPWVREHRRLRHATRAALAQSEAYRRELALALNALRLRIRRREAMPADPDAAGAPLPHENQTEEARRWWH